MTLQQSPSFTPEIVDVELHLKEVEGRHRLMVKFEARLGFGEVQLIPLIEQRLRLRTEDVFSSHPSSRTSTKLFGPLLNDRVPTCLVEDDLVVKKMLVTVALGKIEDYRLLTQEEARWDYNRETPLHCEKSGTQFTYVKGFEVPLYNCGNLGIEARADGTVNTTFEENSEFAGGESQISLLVHLVGYVYFDVAAPTEPADG